jgi:hypothetical protein
MRRHLTRLVASMLVPSIIVAFVACGSDTTSPVAVLDTLVLTAGVLNSLDSTAQAAEQANPGNADLKALVDSSLLALSAGITAKRLDVSTDLTTSPLYFVGIHRAINQSSGGAFSTWTLVGFDDPKHLTTLIEVSGYANSGSGGAPSSVSAAIGDGAGIVNGRFFRVSDNGAVTEWTPTTGSASFVSDAAAGACPGFTPTSTITCALETMHVHFTATAPNGTGAAGSQQVSVMTDQPAPAMRLTYTP